MKFAHLSDCHIGGWRDPLLRELNGKSFIAAIDRSLREKVDFVLISGDLFNTAVPAIDSLKLAVEQLKRVSDEHIPVYIIAGSHDFSPSGKTMIDVLEQAGLVINVAKGGELPDGRLRLEFTEDKKTKVKVTGMIGKKGGLESGYYHVLAKENLEQASGPKIFLFHSAIEEMKPKEFAQVEGMALSLLPRGFDYYAGGHVHVVDRQSMDGYQNIVYPGPIFPNNFAEIEKLRQGSFVLYTDGKIEHVLLDVCPIVCLRVDADNKTPSQVQQLLKEEVQKVTAGALVTLRVSGVLSQGRPGDIVWNDVLHDAHARGARVFLRNTNAFTSKELEVIAVREQSVDEVEASLLNEHAEQLKKAGGDALWAKKLMLVLSVEKQEGERAGDFESRLCSELDVLLGGQDGAK